ncbi:MAG: hypothetical protein ACK4FW_03825 [Stenotrophomonas sp.]
MLNLRLAQRWERLGNRDTEVGVMLLFALLAGLFAWGAYATAYPEHGCVRMGKGNSGPLECAPGRLFDEALLMLLFSAFSATPIVCILWAWIKDMARPLTLKKEDRGG